MNFEDLKQKKQEIDKIAAKYGIKRMFVFGSVARGESSTTSDIDLLIEMKEDVSALGVGGFQYEVEKLLGIRIDVVPTYVLDVSNDQDFVENVQAEAIAL